MQASRTPSPVRLVSAPSVLARRVSVLPLYGSLRELLEDEEGFGALAVVGEGAAGEDCFFSFPCFSASTSFFHLWTSSVAARAMSLFEFDRSLPTKTPARVD